MSAEQRDFIAMLSSARIPHMVVEDMNDPDQATVTIENLFLTGVPSKNEVRVDVVFQFRNRNLDRVWVREG